MIGHGSVFQHGQEHIEDSEPREETVNNVALTGASYRYYILYFPSQRAIVQYLAGPQKL